ncbi:S1C family serine protease [Bifidobacterium vespertilionis]|uniref:Trypsin-like serine protease n=1 Tax=Bifidobacterium vespertilionis TaxID=2562524 RepID=A0A5J5DZD7_9BIFI|nr:trypsin-like peptidase domain-containing protein [Bifidobacterium vespertilionis]KAA8820795.1 trypsin-like serine protease [Bifidobacterium vespertilionis]KAA8822264.1 trypsin-like serine protease [Bifidobacterium vespertilionis]
MADDQQKPWLTPQGDSTSDSNDANTKNETHENEQPTQTLPAPASAVNEDQPTTQLPPTPAVPQFGAPAPAAPAEPAASSASSAAPATPATPQQPVAPTAPAAQPGQPAYGQRMPQGPFNPYPFGAPEPEKPKQDNASHQGFAGFNPFGAQNTNAQNSNTPNGPQNPNAQNVPQNGPVPPQAPNGPYLPGMAGQPLPQGPQNGRGGKGSTTTILTAVIAALVAAALMLGLGWAGITSGFISVPTSSNLNSVGSKTGSGSATATTGEAPDWKTIASNVSSSVVSITTTISNGTGKGSGAIIDTDGHIVTNNHVVEGAQKITVTLSNGNLYSAQIVGTDTTTDLAVIKLDNPPSDLKAVTFADSDELAVGEDVMAIGNPLGYENTATTGIVSALNRPVTVTDSETNSDIVTNAVQIDAAINPGNSGGPTFNAAGQVIGINSSIASTATSSSSAGSIGIGFAIPANLVKRVADEIVKNGKVQHVALGVQVKTGTATADGVTRAGATIDSVSNASGPAAKAGIKAGDVIVGYNDNTVSDVYSLLGYVRASALGDTAKITLVRDGKTLDVTVTLDQEETTVNGSSSSNSNNGSNGSGNGNSQNNGNNGNGYGNSGNGNSGNGYGDNGGLSDPFGQLFGFGNSGNSGN